MIPTQPRNQTGTKVAIITDQHFGARNDSIHFLDYFERFYTGTFFSIIDSESIDTILILAIPGDNNFFDSSFMIFVINL